MYQILKAEHAYGVFQPILEAKMQELFRQLENN